MKYRRILAAILTFSMSAIWVPTVQAQVGSQGLTYLKSSQAAAGVSGAIAALQTGQVQSDTPIAPGYDVYQIHHHHRDRHNSRRHHRPGDLGTMDRGYIGNFNMNPRHSRRRGAFEDYKGYFRYTPKKPSKRKALPTECQVSGHSQKYGSFPAFSPQCLNNKYKYFGDLPQNCIRKAKSKGKTQSLYSSYCLHDYGFHSSQF